MAAPIYHDEFDERMRNFTGYIKHSMDPPRSEVNANTDAKFAALIRLYDQEFAKVIEKLDLILKALQI